MKTTVNQGSTIYVLYYSYRDMPGAEYAQVYINWADANKERMRLYTEGVERAYIVDQTLW